MKMGSTLAFQTKKRVVGKDSHPSGAAIMAYSLPGVVQKTDAVIDGIVRMTCRDSRVPRTDTFWSRGSIPPQETKWHQQKWSRWQECQEARTSCPAGHDIAVE